MSSSYDSLLLLKELSSYVMTSLNRLSQVRQEESTCSFLILSAGSREEALRALNVAQHAVPAVKGRLVSRDDVFHLLRPDSPKTEQLADTPVDQAYAYDKPISAAELSSRTYNALLKGRVTTIGQLCAMELHDLMLLRNFGKKAAAEAVAYRARFGVPAKL